MMTFEKYMNVITRKLRQYLSEEYFEVTQQVGPPGWSSKGGEEK